MQDSVDEIKDSIAYCGLVCALCSSGKSGQCKGCRGKCDGCSIKECAQAKKINGCWECDEFPCDEGMFKKKKILAFIQCAKDEGLHRLAEYLQENSNEGIQYHKADGTPGDYDILDNKDQILLLLRKQRKSIPKMSNL